MKRIILSFLLACGLTACSVGPDYNAPELKFFDKWFATPAINQHDVQLDWWTVFNDPLLESYIHAATLNNNQLKAARANVQRARALHRQSTSGFFPSIDFETGRTRQGTSGTTSSTFSGGARRTIYDAGFDASWEIDIFGGTRRSSEAAGARVEGAKEEMRAALLSVLAEVARNYYEVRGYQKRIAITGKNIELQRKTYELIKSMTELGETSVFDLSRARGQLQLTESRLPDLKAEMKSGIFRLSVLLGQAPEALLDEMIKSSPLPAPPDVVPVGLRSDILRRRPDVRVAERNLAAHTADIGVATADLYPRFFLTGGVGRSASVFSDLFEPESNVFSVGQFFQWPVFQGGSIRANIKVQTAEAVEALALYEHTVLASLADAESALTRYAEKLNTRNELQGAVESQQKASGLARDLFDAGEQDFLAVLDVERELTAFEDELVRAETDTVLNLISLYTALGGGWQVFEPEL